MLGQKVNFEYPIALRFECTKCGICCGDAEGKIRHILLLSGEAEHIAKETSQHIQKFARKIEGKAPYNYEMKKTLENGKCVFLAKNRCTIYHVRPLICRFYPFELNIGANQKYLFRCTKECPGIGKGKELRKNYFEDLFQLACSKTEAYRKSHRKQ